MEKNNINPKYWGSHMWESIHFVAFGYPDNPTHRDRDNYKNFYLNLGNVLPCSSCALSYKKFISKDGLVELTDEDLKSKNTLCKWTYKLHDQVNKKLCVAKDKIISEDTFYNKYNNIFKCNNNKCNAFISIEEFVDKLEIYACKRGYVKFKETFIQNSKKNKNVLIEYASLVKEYMINKNIGVIEDNGIYKGLPTKLELLLISMLNTHIQQDEYENILINLEKLEL